MGMALVTCASVMPAREMLALATANTGSTPKRTHGPIASSSRSSVLSECPGAAVSGTASAVATPASVACTPDSITHTQMNKPTST